MKVLNMLYICISFIDMFLMYQNVANQTILELLAVHMIAVHVGGVIYLFRLC